MNNTFRLRNAVLLVIAGLSCWGCGDRGTVQVAPPSPPPRQVDAAVLAVTQGLVANKPQVVWDALPDSYQNDVTTLVHRFAGRMDRDIWNKAFEVLAKIATVLKDKKEVILGIDKLKETPQFSPEEAARNWEKVVALVMTLTHNDVADLDKFKQIDIRQFLGTTGVEFMLNVRGLNQISKDELARPFKKLEQTTATLVSQEGDSAVVKLETPGQDAEVTAFVRVEGKWIPRQMADQWQAKINEANENLRNISTEKVAQIKPQIMQVLTAADGSLDVLLAASTSDQFEQSAKLAAGQIGGMVMMMMAGQGGPEGGVTPGQTTP